MAAPLLEESVRVDDEITNGARRVAVTLPSPQRIHEMKAECKRVFPDFLCISVNKLTDWGRIEFVLLIRSGHSRGFFTLPDQPR